MEKEFTILNEEGLHARPAGILVKSISGFDSEIEISTAAQSVNGKSIMSVMTLGLTKDDRFTVKAEGEDAEKVIKKVTDLIDNKFYLQ